MTEVRMGDRKRSRADRLADARDKVYDAARQVSALNGEIEEALDQLKGELPKEPTDRPKKGRSGAKEPVKDLLIDPHEVIAGVHDVLAGVDELVADARGDVEALAEEIGAWREAVEEHFSTTDRYARLQECEEQLDGFVGALHDYPVLEPFDENTRGLTGAQLRTLLEALSEQLDTMEAALQTAAEESEEIVFPTARD